MQKSKSIRLGTRFTALVGGFLALFSALALAQRDPGPGNGPSNRGGSGAGGNNGSVSTGDPIPNLTPGELAAFKNGKVVFQEVDSVTGVLTPGRGLGPTFNLDSCSGCHSAPAIGGSSPAANPQVAVAGKAGAINTIPPFISANGPIREARFVKSPAGTADGGVRGLFTITGRSDAAGCIVSQPDFAAELAAGNVVFRIPTPLFGSGLIEAIDDAAILSNMAANASAKAALGISGHENRNPNDGSLTRFGWKAQNKSLTVFAGEAYNVEQGVTNDLFPNERNSNAGCRFNATPEDHVDANGGRPNRPAPAVSDLINFVFFMRFLAPPAAGAASVSSNNGRSLFASVGCALCHTPSLPTASNVTAALSNTTANLYSDLCRSQHGQRLGGWNHARIRDRKRVSNCATVGFEAEAFLAARWPHKRSCGCNRSSRESGFRSEQRHLAIQSIECATEAGPAEFSALVVAAHAECVLGVDRSSRSTSGDILSNISGWKYVVNPTGQFGVYLGVMRCLATSRLMEDSQLHLGAARDFDVIVRQHRPKIFRFILASLRDEDAAETLTQDCFVKAHRALKGFRGDCSIETWLLKVAVNLVRDHARNRRLQFWKRSQTNAKRVDDLEYCLSDGRHSAETRVVLNEQVKAVWSAAAKLPERQRTVFLLRFVEDMDLLEIAAATGLKEGTVKAHIFRALQTVRAELGIAG